MSAAKYFYILSLSRHLQLYCCVVSGQTSHARTLWMNQNSYTLYLLIQCVERREYRDSFLLDLLRLLPIYSFIRAELSMNDCIHRFQGRHRTVWQYKILLARKVKTEYLSYIRAPGT